MIGRNLISELARKEYKYNENDIIFIAKDSDGKLVWLERGNEVAGLEHIVKNHGADFSNAYDIQKEEIALYLYNAITNGKVVKSIPSKIKGGLDRIYEYDGNYYTLVGMGDNGFIVTAFPTRK